MGGGYQPPDSRGWRKDKAIRQTKSQPVATATMNSRPLIGERDSAALKRAGSSDAFGWQGAGSKASSKSSACAMAPFASAAIGAPTRSLNPMIVACGAPATERASSTNGTISSLIPLAANITPTPSKIARLAAAMVACGKLSKRLCAT